MRTRPRFSQAYLDNLHSPHWRSVRYEALKAAGFRCTRCGRGGQLDAHHAHGYPRLGREDPRELVALCRRCHDRVHGRTSKVATIRRMVMVLFWLILAFIGWLALIALGAAQLRLH